MIHIDAIQILKYTLMNRSPQVIWEELFLSSIQLIKRDFKLMQFFGIISLSIYKSVILSTYIFVSHSLSTSNKVMSLSLCLSVTQSCYLSLFLFYSLSLSLSPSRHFRCIFSLFVSSWLFFIMLITTYEELNLHI